MGLWGPGPLCLSVLLPGREVSVLLFMYSAPLLSVTLSTGKSDRSVCHGLGLLKLYAKINPFSL
jgi:hypothetical protein